MDGDEYEVRFYCDACGHNFCLELDDEMPKPKFCIFCASPIYYRESEYDYDDDEEEEEEEEEEDDGFHL